MKTQLLLCLLCSSLLTACGGDEPNTTVETPANKQAELPADAPTPGTPISSVTDKLQEKKSEDGYTELAWEDLELPGQGLADIIKQFQPRIDEIPEGDPAEDALLDELQDALNRAPVNPALHGKQVKIPGFISPLEVDNEKGVVKEFLLVPYFGACIHVPPPPLNQTLLVKPQEGKSIGMERMYEPVWVYGTMRTDTIHTQLASAGYQIHEARVELYTGTVQAQD